MWPKSEPLGAGDGGSHPVPEGGASGYSYGAEWGSWGVRGGGKFGVVYGKFFKFIKFASGRFRIEKSAIGCLLTDKVHSEVRSVQEQRLADWPVV